MVQSTSHLRLAEQGLLHHTEPGLFRGWPFGMEWSPICSPVTSNREYSSRNSLSNLKQHYLAVLGLGALLSSPTWRGTKINVWNEWMNEWKVLDKPIALCDFSLILVQFLHKLVSGILHCTVYETDQDDPVQKQQFAIFILGRACIWFKADPCVIYDPPFVRSIGNAMHGTSLWLLQPVEIFSFSLYSSLFWLPEIGTRTLLINPMSYSVHWRTFASGRLKLMKLTLRHAYSLN